MNSLIECTSNKEFQILNNDARLKPYLRLYGILGVMLLASNAQIFLGNTIFLCGTSKEPLDVFFNKNQSRKVVPKWLRAGGY